MCWMVTIVFKLMTDLEHKALPAIGKLVLIIVHINPRSLRPISRNLINRSPQSRSRPGCLYSGIDGITGMTDDHLIFRLFE